MKAAKPLFPIMAGACIALVPLPYPAKQTAAIIRDPEVFDPGAMMGFIAERAYDGSDRLRTASFGIVAPILPSTGWARLHPISSTRSALRELVVRQSIDSGMDPAYMVKLALRESAFNPFAHSQFSSAGGLYQFTEGTWLCAVHDFGSMAGIADAGLAIRGRDGRCTVSRPLDRYRLLNLRFDPVMSTRVAAGLTLHNYQRLKNRYGKAPSWGELYALHFFGEATGMAFLNRCQTTPGMAAARFVPAAARSNPTLFFDHNGRPRSLSDIYRFLAF